MDVVTLHTVTGCDARGYCFHVRSLVGGMNRANGIRISLLCHIITNDSRHNFRNRKFQSSQQSKSTNSKRVIEMNATGYCLLYKSLKTLNIYVCGKPINSSLSTRKKYGNKLFKIKTLKTYRGNATISPYVQRTTIILLPMTRIASSSIKIQNRNITYLTSTYTGTIKSLLPCSFNSSSNISIRAILQYTLIELGFL